MSCWKSLTKTVRRNDWVIDISRPRSNALCTLTPELGEFVPVKRILAAIAAAVSLATLAACGSSGTHTQSLTPSASASSSTSRPTASSVPATPSRSTPPRSAPRPLPTPSVTPPAQGAVNAYTAALNVLLRWDVDPRKAKPKELAPYVTPKVLQQFVASFKNMAQHGLAYRGTPDTSHLKIVTADSSTVVFTDCMVPSRTAPYTQYVVATGKPVPPTVPAGLHPRVITMLNQRGRWRMSSDIPNFAKTCSP